MATHEERAASRKAYASEIREGATVDMVASRHKVAVGVVYAACREHGVSIKKVPWEKILKKLFDPDLSWADIAMSLGIKKSRIGYVYKLASQAGIPGLPYRATTDLKMKDDK